MFTIFTLLALFAPLFPVHTNLYKPVKNGKITLLTRLNCNGSLNLSMPENSHSESFQIGPERQLPAASETDFRVLAQFVDTLEQRIKNYNGATERDRDALAGMMVSYRLYLEQRYRQYLQHKNFVNQQEFDEFLKGLVEQEFRQIPSPFRPNLPPNISPSDFQGAVAQSLTNRAGITRNLEQLCRAFGINYEQTDKVFAPTVPSKPFGKTGGRERVKPKEKKDKFKELIPFLLENNLTGEQINITEGRVQQTQMRGAPYSLVTIPSLNKQILICDQLGEGAYVSKTILDHNVYADLNKQQWASEQGLVKVSYDSQGNWLKRIKGLLWPEQAGTENTLAPEISGKNILELNGETPEQAKAEVLAMFPTSREYLRFFDHNGKITSEQKFFRKLRKVLVPESATSVDVAVSEAIKFSQLIYGSEGQPDANSEYAFKLEQRDKSYLKKVFTEGLPEGVNYFFSDAEIQASKRSFEKGLDDFEFTKLYLTAPMDVGSHKMWSELRLTFLDFLAVFRPDIHRNILDALSFAKKIRKGEGVSYKEKDIYAACMELYPDSRQFQYLIDLEKPEELAKMIRGDYNLKGLSGLLRGQNSKSNSLYALSETEPFPDFETFNDHVLAPSKYASSQVSKVFAEHFGFGSVHFVSKMGITKTEQANQPNIGELLEALKKVYPGDPQLKYLIDRRSINNMRAMIAGTYPGLSERNVWSFINKTGQGEKIHLQATPCPNFEAFKKTFFTESGQPNHHLDVVSRKMRMNYGFGPVTFATAIGVKGEKKDKIPGIIHLLNGLRVIYPESENEIQGMIVSYKVRGEKLKIAALKRKSN